MPTYPKGTVNWAKQMHEKFNPEYCALVCMDKGMTGAQESRMHQLNKQLGNYEAIMDDPEAPLGDPIFSHEEQEHDFGQVNLMDLVNE